MVNKFPSLAKMSRLLVLILSVASLFFSYMAPIHFLPWTTFYNEWLFFLFLGFLISLFIFEGRLLLVNPLVWLLLLLTVVVYAVFGEGLGVELTSAGLFVLYLLATWVAYVVGVNLRSTSYLSLILLVILFAAVLSAFVAILQWSGVVSAGDWDPSFILYSQGGGRVSSNIGQANNLGTLLVIGLGVVGYMLYRGVVASRLLIFLLWISVPVLAVGIYLSGSRTAVLNLILWPVFFIFWSYFKRSKFHIYSVFPILILLMLYAAMPAVIEWMGWFPVQEARSMVADGARARLWSMVVEAISESPWIGYGFGAVANIHLRFSPEYGDFSFMIARHAHNSILDMLVVFGIPIGILIVAPVCYLLVRAWSLCGRADEKFLWLMAASMVVHGMLEFPLHYGFFLWLLFLIFGVLVGRKVYVINFSYSGVYAIGYLAIFGFFSFSIWSSYVQMERIFTLHRQQGSDVVNRLLVEQDFPLRKSLFVEPYERLQWVTTPLDEIYYLSDERLRDLERYASYYPLPALVFRMALAQAARGNAEQASWWAERMCRMFDPSVCASAAEEWKRFGTENPNWLALPWDKWLSANAAVQ